MLSYHSVKNDLLVTQLDEPIDSAWQSPLGVLGVCWLAAIALATSGCGSPSTEPTEASAEAPAEVTVDSGWEWTELCEPNDVMVSLQLANSSPIERHAVVEVELLNQQGDAVAVLDDTRFGVAPGDAVTFEFLSAVVRYESCRWTVRTLPEPESVAS